MFSNDLVGQRTPVLHLFALAVCLIIHNNQFLICVNGLTKLNKFWKACWLAITDHLFRVGLIDQSMLLTVTKHDSVMAGMLKTCLLNETTTAPLWHQPTKWTTLKKKEVMLPYLFNTFACDFFYYDLLYFISYAYT